MIILINFKHMITSIFSIQKRPINIVCKDSSRDRRLLRTKYNKLMQSRQVLIWVR